MGDTKIVRLLAVMVGLGACNGDDQAAAPDAGEPVEWALLTEEEPSALLSVWSASEDDVWVVGGDDRTESEHGPLVLHYDGAAWARLDPGVRDVDLWWVFGFPGGPVFFSGSGAYSLMMRDCTPISPSAASAVT